MSELIGRCYNYSKRRPIYIILMVVVLFLSYGFYATHYTIHIDQLVTEYYNGNVMIGAGRWSAPIIHIFTNWMNFAPYWHTLLMAILLFASAMVFGQVFMKASEDKLPDYAVLIFSVIYISYPIINAQLTFPILNIALAYLLSSIALWIITSNEKLKIKNVIITLILLIVSVDLYESFAMVFLVGFFGVMLIKNIFVQEKILFKEFFKTALKGVLFLLSAIVIDLIISKIICLICCGTTHFWYNSNTEILWSYGVLDAAIWLVRTLFAFYIIGAHSCFYIFLFDVTVILGTIVFIVLSIKRKSIFPILIFICVAVSSLALAIVTGMAPAYSQSQALPAFVAMIIMLLFCMLPNKKYLKSIFAVLLVIITLNQTKLINNYAVNNYERYEYETNLLRDVGKELTYHHSVTTKPVAFVVDSNILPSSLKETRNAIHPIVKKYQNAFEKVFDSVIPNVYFQKMGGWFGADIESTKGLADYLSKTPRAYYSFIERTNFKDNIVGDVYGAMNRLGYHLIDCSEDEYNIAKEMEIENIDNSLFCIKETVSLIIVRFFDVAY